MRVAIIGRTEILYDTAHKLAREGHDIVGVLTSKEAPEYKRTAEDFAGLAKSHNAPFCYGSRIDQHAEFLRDLRAEIAVSINFTGVVPQSIIDIFPLGVLNAHGGDLPRYRGNACQAWAILNGESRIGLCIHRMVGGELDSGDIVARDYLEIDERTKVTAVWSWMELRTPDLMVQAVAALASDPTYVLERQSKHISRALRCYPRRPEDCRVLWTESASQVLRLVNASNRPYSGAFAYLEGKRVTIWDAEIVRDEELFLAVPGQVTRVADGAVEVACGSGKLRLLEIEIDGNVVSPSHLIRSIRQRLT